MGLKIDISHNIDEAIKDLSKFERTLVPKVVVRTVNEIAKQVKVQASRQIAKQTNIKVSEVKSSIKVLTAKTVKVTPLSGTEIIAVVFPLRPGAAKTRETNLIAYLTKGKRRVGAFRKKAGVTAKVWGRNKLYRGTFIGRGKDSGKLLVFSRTGTGRSAKLKAVAGPSVVRTFGTEAVEDVMKDVVAKQFPKIFRSKLDFELSRL